jgi:predicted ATP-grasp superfamily ATP-dependent carboligase
VFLPTGEDTLVVARYAPELRASGVQIPVAPYSTLRRLHRKDESMELARRLDIPTPKTIVPTSVSDLRAFGRDVGFPIVLKRTSSSSARGVSYIGEADLDPMNDGGTFDEHAFKDMVAQEYVHGTGYGVSMLFNRGQLRAKFTHERLRELPVTGGISTLRVGVVCPILEEYAQRLLQHVQFHGVAMVEFKHDKSTGQSWLIEVNPRFWGSLALAIQSGVDFPYLLFRMANEGDVEPVLAYKSGQVVKWLLGEAGSAFTGTRRAARPRQGLVPTGYDDLHWDDPFAFIGGAALAIWKRLATRRWHHDRMSLSVERLDRAHAASHR